ncbi:hypothetical protein D3C80_1243880 [compost metagenome]
MVEQFAKPVRIENHTVRAEQQQVLAPCLAGSKIEQRRHVGGGVIAQHPQHIAAHVGHGLEPGARLGIAAGVVDDKYFVVVVGGFLDQRFHAALQGHPFITGGNDDRHPRLRSMVVVHPVEHGQAAALDPVLDTQAPQVLGQHSRIVLDHGRRRQPGGVSLLRLEQYLTDMLDHLQAVVFHQAPEQIVWAQLIELGIETAQLDKALAL